MTTDAATSLPIDDALLRWGEGLVPARLAGGTIADPPARLSLHQGYRLADLAAGGLGTAVGWKIGATSAGGMAFLGVPEPIRGRLFAERVWQDGAQAMLAGDRWAEAEPEVALLLAGDLVAGADPLAAVGRACAAAEIVRPSHADPFGQGAGFIVADNAAGLGALLGPDIPLAALADPAAIVVTLSLAGGASCTGTADAVLGNPLAALAWLATALGRIPAGSWVMTGAMARAIPLDRPGILTLSAPGHGSATLNCNGF